MRRMVSDDQDVYRVVVVRKRQISNPEYRQGSGKRPYIYTDETYETSYGPYNTIGTAKGIQTRETRNIFGDTERGVVDSWIEKATTTWEKVS